jgi:hypothetical protein
MAKCIEKTNNLVPKINAQRSERNKKNTESFNNLQTHGPTHPVQKTAPARITCEQLHDYMRRKISILLLDLRDHLMYQTGHISSTTCVNVQPSYVSQA